MIRRMSHFTVHVLDQDEARAFYIDRLGFEVRTDQRMGDFRWLTVGPKSQPDIEIVLMPIRESPVMSARHADMLRELVQSGNLGAGVLQSDDIHATYKALSARGVTFQGEPVERPYGIEAMMRDNSGNWFSVVQRPR
ncbi:MAG: VOC family protein [Myxococcales bacterium]|nr:VOC family protein [Myxococcales bacterium]